MRYLNVYVNLMRKAQERNWTKSSAPTYVEKHHIFPESIFGKNKFVVYLTAREHYLAHGLLYKGLKKRYGPINISTKKMRYAWWRLSNGGGKYCNSRLYENLRIEFSAANRGKNHPLYRSGKNSSWYGRTHSAETKRKMRISQLGRVVSNETKEKLRGKNNPMYGTKPWMNPKSRDNLIIWKKAGMIYNLWKQNGEPGSYKLATLLKVSDLGNFSRSNLAGLHEKLKTGWIPESDSDYLNWKLQHQ